LTEEQQKVTGMEHPFTEKYLLENTEKLKDLLNEAVKVDKPLAQHGGRTGKATWQVSADYQGC